MMDAIIATARHLKYTSFNYSLILSLFILESIPTLTKRQHWDIATAITNTQGGA